MTGLDTVGNIGKSYIPEAIQKTVRPNNIGVGTWNKHIAEEVATATSQFNGVTKITKVTGYVAVGVDTGVGIYNNVQNYNEGLIDASRIGTDAVVDTASGLTALGVSTGAGALYGSIIPGAGNVAGALVGFGTGVVYMIGTEVWEPGGMSLKNRAKEGLYNWWTEDSSNGGILNDPYNTFPQSI